MGGKSIEHNASIIGKNCQHNGNKLYKMHVLPRIVRFGLICGNDFVIYVLTKVAKSATKRNSKC